MAAERDLYEDVSLVQYVGRDEPATCTLERSMKAWAQPFAYIRRSVASRADPGDISREFQTEAVRSLAGEEADALVVLDQDWGRSAATDKTDRRLAFLGLLDKIEAGEVSALYAYSADRLARSVEWSARLLNACRRAGVPIITTQGRVNPGDEAATLLFHVLAATNEAALSGMEKKAQASVERRQARNIAAGLAPNHGMGRKPYGARDGEALSVVMAAFDQARSFMGAAKLLNGCPRDCAEVHDHWREPTRSRDGKNWSGTTVGRIVQRARPDVTKQLHRGVAAKAPRIFTGLLRCDCGRTLTSMPRHSGINGQRTGTVAYFCSNGRTVAGHPRPYVVAERFIRPWAEEVLAEYRERVRKVGRGRPDEGALAASKAALDAKRDRWLEQYGEGLIDKATRDKHLTAIATERERIVAQEEVRYWSLKEGTLVLVNEPVIDFNGDPAEVNAALRRFWDHVEMRHFRGRFEPAVPVWRPGVREWLEGEEA